MSPSSFGMANKPQTHVQLPESCCDIIRSICATQHDMMRIFSLQSEHTSAIAHYQPVMVTPERADLIQAICLNEIKYALPTRINAIMLDPKRGAAFTLWVNTAARMLDSFRNVQQPLAQRSFLNGLDPLFASLAHMATSMSEVETFLEQLHLYCPQFDELFFRGTRFLEEQSEDTPTTPDRVSSSVDVLALSPEDAEIYSQF